MSLIIVLDDGRSVEQETHRQRMASAIRCHCLNQLEMGESIPQSRTGLPVVVDEINVHLETV